MPAHCYDFTRQRSATASVDDLAAGARGMEESKGLRGGERREAFVVMSGAAAAPRRIMGIPAAFQGFPPPGLSPGGRGEPQVVRRA